MPKEKKMIPEIRFPGFSDPWEQRKLGELCERVTRKNKNGESDLPLTIASQYGLIDQRDFFNKVVAAKDMSNYYLLKKGEFAYNKSYSNGFDYGSIKRLNAYEQGCLSTLYICFGITSDDIESDYLECFFDTLKWYSDITMICAEGARNHGLLNVDTKAFFDEVTIEMPTSKEEQKQISTYLNNLDNLITLHQRKYESLKKLKKGMLQKMFPKEGSSFPEIRFPGFSDPWEQRKLGEFVNIVTGKLDANAMKEDGEYDFYTSGIQKYKIDVPAFEGPAITIAGNGATVGYMHLADGKFNAYQRTYVLSEFQANREFLFYEIGNKLPKKIGKEARTGNIPYIVMDMLTDLKISIPSEQEQKKIGAYLTELDNLITLHQRKCDSLKKLKNGLLQKMFI